MVHITTRVPPGSDVQDERAGQLAFEPAEDAAIVVSEMGAIVHVGRDGSPRGLLTNGAFCIRE